MLLFIIVGASVRDQTLQSKSFLKALNVMPKIFYNDLKLHPNLKNHTCILNLSSKEIKLH